MKNYFLQKTVIIAQALLDIQELINGGLLMFKKQVYLELMIYMN
jgi:hypothetical protein